LGRAEKEFYSSTEENAQLSTFNSQLCFECWMLSVERSGFMGPKRVCKNVGATHEPAHLEGRRPRRPQKCFAKSNSRVRRSLTLPFARKTNECGTLKFSNRLTGIGTMFRFNVPNEVRETAVFTERVGLIAEVSNDLENSLLKGRPMQDFSLAPTHQSVSRVAQDRIILRAGPSKVSGFRGTFHLVRISGICSRPKPRQNDIDCQIGGAFPSEQRL